MTRHYVVVHPAVNLDDHLIDLVIVCDRLGFDFTELIRVDVPTAPRHRLLVTDTLPPEAEAAYLAAQDACALHTTMLESS